MDTIHCKSIYGNWVDAPRSRMIFRPSVYAVMLRDEQALLMTNRTTGKFAFPGGGIELGERMEDALRRELREEAGIEMEILRFLQFREHFFYYDPKDLTLHSFMFYYLCQACGEVPADFVVQDDESQAPQWLPWKEYALEAFQSPEEHAILVSAAP